jgi:glycosyltransferase involved in cell wall biosynthesis
MIRILAATRYGPKAASSRLRFFQYIAPLREQGIDLIPRPLFSDDYLDALYRGSRVARLWHGTMAYLRRLATFARIGQADVVWLEKELFPYLPGLPDRILACLGVPVVVDIDDAIFHSYDHSPHWLVRTTLSRKMAGIMRRAAAVMAGNEYLADYARRSGARMVEVVPTVLDVGRYRPRTHGDVAGPITVVWIGTPITSKFLPLIHEPMRRLIAAGVPVRLHAIGADPAHVPADLGQVAPWSEDTEAAEVAKGDIGVMPLPDEPWERGKCGYKLIQYMACGLPVVASPVGVNATLVRPGVNGLLARDEEGWVESLRLLAGNAAMRSAMGAAGRRLVESAYSIPSQAGRIAAILRQACGKT